MNALNYEFKMSLELIYAKFIDPKCYLIYV
jgi:hypothetical protein